jgi:ribosomal protein S27AE
MTDWFGDSGDTLYSFADSFLVVCPRCSGCAAVASYGRPWQPQFRPPRLACGKCGYAKDWQAPEWMVSLNLGRRRLAWQSASSGLGLHLGAPVDAYFGLPLWLQTPCCGEVLWAYSEKHLAYLEDYIRAGLREGGRGNTLAGQLPTWMKTAKHRDEVLACIAKLKEKLLA